jgi:uncharacterized protein YdeI (YjbR/CyaY-like superfamily)
VAHEETGPDGKPLLTVDSAADLRGWLATEHARTRGVWLVRARPRSARVADVPYDDVLDELLAFGWIDSTIKVLDEERAMLWISPRRKGSVWSRPNKERVARLVERQRMAPAGLAAVERARQDGTWSVLDGPENLEVPDDLAAALAADPVAQASFAAFPPSARKNYLGYVATARTATTRARRIADVVERSAQNRRPG